jgi:hypothetical protein
VGVTKFADKRQVMLGTIFLPIIEAIFLVQYTKMW